MNLSAILAQHQQLLDKVKSSMAKNTISQADLAQPLEVKQKTIAELSGRIDSLTKQKNAASDRFDAAIAAHQAQMSKLKDGLAQDESVKAVLTATPAQVLKNVSAAARETGTVKDTTIKKKPSDRDDKDDKDDKVRR